MDHPCYKLHAMRPLKISYLNLSVADYLYFGAYDSKPSYIPSAS